MGYNTRKIGTEYERKAGAYLEAKGYVIQEYNFRCRMGEIDIIARDGKCLVFCEVKYRSGREADIRQRPWMKRSRESSQNAPCTTLPLRDFRESNAVLTWSA